MISIIIPTYNERENILPLVQRIDGAMSGYSYEVVFVDDNSADGTAEAVNGLSSDYPVKAIVRTDERGLASAVVHGIGHAAGDILVVMDADLQHPPEVIPALVQKAESGADVVIASRYVKGGGCREWGLVRKMISKVAISIAHLLLPQTRLVNDPMSGFFLFKRPVVASARLQPKGYKILLELLMEGDFRDVAESPYVFENRKGGSSKLNTRQEIEYLKHIYSLMRRTGELVRFLKFCGVGLSGVFVNMGLLWLLTEHAGLQYLLSAAFSIETSIITNFILNDFFTFPLRRTPGVKSFFNRLWKFNVVSLAGLAINLGVLWLFTEVLDLYYLLSNLFGIAAATMWNYLVNSSWTWR